MTVFVDILTQIKMHQPDLPRAEKRVATYILAHVDEMVHATSGGVAKAVGVSEPTVIRFCRRVGCEGWRSFRVQLAQSLAVGQRYLRPSPKDYNAQSLVEKVVGEAQRALGLVREQVDWAKVEQASQWLIKARRISVVGMGGGSTSLAEDLQHRLFRCDLTVNFFRDGMMQQLLLATFDQRDCLVLVSATGKLEELMQLVALADTYGVPTIAITRRDSPLAQKVKVALEIEIEEHRDILKPTAVRYALMAVMDILASAVAHNMGPRAVDSMRRMRTVLLQTRDQTNREPLGD